jgi:hypothetical protein
VVEQLCVPIFLPFTCIIHWHIIEKYVYIMIKLCIKALEHLIEELNVLMLVYMFA